MNVFAAQFPIVYSYNLNILNVYKYTQILMVYNERVNHKEQWHDVVFRKSSI